MEKTDEALLTVGELNHSEMIENVYYRVNKNLITNGGYTEPFQSDNAERLTKEELEEMLSEWRKYNE